MTKIPLILSHLSLSSSSPFGSTAQLETRKAAARLGTGTAAARQGTGTAAAWLGTGKTAGGRGRWRHGWGREGGDMAGDRDGGDAARDGDGGGADMVGAGGIWCHRPSHAAEPSNLPQPTPASSSSPAAPALPTSSPTPISILLDDLFLECLAGVPYASLPQLPTTSPRPSPPSRPRRAPRLPPRSLRRAHGEPTDVGMVVVMRTRSQAATDSQLCLVVAATAVAATLHRRRLDGNRSSFSFPCKVNKMARGKYVRA
uniref:Uncharacterized protein n=1 Tax=Oryza glumipatula TaxID=40148 RepID=A0A0E0B829_9ORYZ